MAVTVLPGPALASYVNDRFRGTYDITPDPYPWLAGAMDQNIPSERLVETYAAFEPAPYSRIKIDGQAITKDGFKAFSYNCENKDWEIAVRWRRKDREDDRLQDIVRRAEQSGANFKVQNARVAAQILGGTTDSELLDAQPTAPDGANLCATTAGGANRFGVDQGNSMTTGNGYGSGMAVRKDFYAARAQFRRFLNPRGKPRWTSDVIGKGFLIIYAPQMTEAMNEAFIQAITASTAGGAGAGVSNTVMLAGYKVELQEFEWLTGNSWFICLKGAPVKPLFHQSRKALWMEYADAANSDFGREEGDEAAYFKQRDGYGINVADAIIKMNN